ncbi:[acyl-carrier-protein] S-malonyltransferase [Zalaria obscura]|uniref:[acyl-carrier-protein] S-malonyltransferase n=1 Tax=Zalaria obscura TaxID=2024903 RepID=A0ACC3SEC2_9PEZI
MEMSLKRLTGSALRQSSVPNPELLPRTLPHSVLHGKYGTRWASSSTTSNDASKTPKSTHPRTALFFPGQGVQRVGMAEPWLSAFPSTVKPILDEIDETLKVPLTRIMAEGPNSLLTATENAQPAIMATSILILRVLEKEFGFDTEERVDVVLGHSLGEFAALVAGGFLRQQDALRLVKRRAEVMAEVSKEACQLSGGEVGMVALVCEGDKRDSLIEAIHEFLGHGSVGTKMDSGTDYDLPAVQQVLIANINSKNQIVLSGNIERIKTLLTHLRQFGGHDPRAVRLKADSPFHSPLMKPAADVMIQMLDEGSSVAKGEDMVMWPGIMPCVSNVSARPFTDKDQLKDLLARSCVETVQWHDSVRYLDQEEKIRRWIGIGPGKVGRNLVGKEVGMQGAVKGGGVWGINDPREVEEILKALDETEKYEE